MGIYCTNQLTYSCDLLQPGALDNEPIFNAPASAAQEAQGLGFVLFMIR
jgi:hypothetical protein